MEDDQYQGQGNPVEAAPSFYANPGPEIIIANHSGRVPPPQFIYSILIQAPMQRRPPPPPPPPPPAVISSRDVYLASISAFLNLLILKWQGSDATPFHTHPKTMCVIVISCLLLLYFVAFSRPTGYTRHITHFIKFFWSLCVASLASLLLPEGSILTRPILCVACLVPSIVFALLDYRVYCRRVFRQFQEWVEQHVQIGQRTRFIAASIWPRFAILRHLISHIPEQIHERV